MAFFDQGSGDGRFFPRRAVIVAVVIGVLSASAGGAWASSKWVEGLKTGSSGEAHAQSAAAPTGVTAACTGSSAMTIKVSWTAVAKATSYTVYDATTSATGTYASVASGVTTVTYTTGTLGANNYWFEVIAATGTNWVSAKSAASSESTISSSGCTQP